MLTQVEHLADLPFGQQVIVATIAPAITVVLGSLITVGVGSWIIGNKLAEAARKFQSTREDRLIRDELIKSMASTAGNVYIALQSYDRALGPPSGIDDQRAPILDEAYERGSVEANTLESRIEAMLGRDVALEWHAAWDCLTIRYFKTRMPTADLTSLYSNNAGPDHSGLTVQQLQQPVTSGGPLKRQYKAKLKTATQGVATRPLFPPI